MLVELHLLTSHAPANLNRDDFGRPKTAFFGGTERARISSQSQKRALRKSDYLQDRMGEKLSTRSLRIPHLIYDELKDQYQDQADKLERLQLACEAVTNALGKPDKDDSLKTSQIVFLTQDEIHRVVDFVRETVESDVKLTQKGLKEFGSQVAAATGLNVRPSDGIDMALFGRMTTDDANSFAAVDASMQVAHPIATHTTITETDYFTAVDDLTQASGERGSGHIGESDFNSAVFYKYFSCNLDQLIGNLGKDRKAAAEGLSAVLEAACKVTPSGKQNSFASHSQADVALLVVRKTNLPCSLANAFERPVTSESEGYLAQSTQRLIERYCRLKNGYSLEDDAILFTVEDFEPKLKSGLQDCFRSIDRTDKLVDLWDFLRNQIGAGAPAEA